MSNFNYKDFVRDSGYVTYGGKFVARFKYSRKGTAPFLKFLAKNFTTEEYFARLDAGESPLKILESKGYEAPGVAEARKRAAEWLERYSSNR